MSLISEEPRGKLSEPHRNAGNHSAEVETAAVREQLARIVASPVFRQSRRCPRLLSHVVDLALDAEFERLKERTLGVEVFDHEPDYDTNQFPVVRTTAHEIRKRLAQYYQEPGHESELRIELPPGSYVPEFHPPNGAVLSEKAGLAPAKRPLAAIAVAAALVIAVMLAISMTSSPATIDLFWAPVVESSAPVLFSLGPGGPDTESSLSNPLSIAETASAEPYTPEQAVELGDASAFASIAGYVRLQGGMFRSQLTRSSQFEDFKAGPVVFIGPVTRWMEVLAPDLRFSVQRDPQGSLTWIEDRENPADRTWLREVTRPPTGVNETYALVTRMWNPKTGQMIVSIAGLSPYGTGAAGELLSDPNHMEELARDLPDGWDQQNMQIVIATQRVGNSYSTPRVAATHFW